MLTKRLFIGMLSIMLVLAGLPSIAAPTQAAGEPAVAEYLGENRETVGNWVGIYGGEGYILPFYNATVAGGRQTPTPTDVVELPAYVSSYSQYWQSYWVVANPSSDVRALQSPDSTIRKAITVYQWQFGYTFNVSDNNEHLFTVYACDFSNVDSVVQKIEIMDMNGKVLNTRIVKTINSGVYISYKVKGSFKIRATKMEGYAAYMNGFFFDTIPQNTVSNIQLSYETPRKVHISWDNADYSQKTSILRKKAGEPDFSEIATVNGDVTQYVDQNLDAGATYYYKLRSINEHKYSNPSEEYSIQLPAYMDTVLAFLDTSISVQKPRQEIVIKAKLSDWNGSPLPGENIIFELQGQYVGEYIDGNIGTTVTDENGIATVSYAPLYAGQYDVKASFPYNDEELLNTSAATIPFAVNVESWEMSPMVLRVSDAVEPGKLLSVNGYGINGDTVEIAVDKAAGTEPPANARRLEIVQTDRNGYFAVARMPQDMTAGVYNVWVKNEYGWSMPILLNGPRPKFISEYEAFNGLKIELVGRNLDGVEFGAQRATEVRLNNGAEGIYAASIEKVNPFAVTFKIKDIPIGDYWVEVSNDGGQNWVKLENGQKIKIVEAGADPLDLGVSWAKDFKWNMMYNVLEYGASPNDDTDDTLAVQAAVDAAKQSGGGVVYFPVGAYYVSAVKLPSGVVLLGEDEYGTQLTYTGTGANMINSFGDGKTEGKQGIAKLSLKVQPSGICPDTFIWLGHDWGPARNDMNLRTAKEFFIHEVNLDYPIEQEPTGGRGLGVVIIAKERFLFTDNNFKGWAANPNRTIVNKYIAMRNNHIEYSNGYTSSGGDYSFVEDNSIKMHPEPKADQHGISATGNCYIYNNVVENTGHESNANNDGEPIMVEMPGGYFNYGEILRAEDNELYVAPVTELKNPTLSGDFLGIVIVDGRGLGQYRRVTGIDGNKITVDKPWDIMPDKSSKFTLICPKENETFYKNTVKNSAKGIWHYGNAIDAVSCGNVSLDSEGVFVAGFFNPAQIRLNPNYFVRIADNEVEGVSKRSKHAGIGYATGRQPGVGAYYAVQAYGIEIRDNKIVGVPSAIPESTTECPPLSGIFLSTADPDYNNQYYDGKGVSGDGTNTIIEDNILENLNTGITVMRCNYGQIISGNLYKNVGQFIDDNGSENTIIENNNEFNDQTPPVTTAKLFGNNKNGWYNSDVSVGLNATDDVAGIKETEYSLDGGTTWKTYEVPFVISDDGTYEIQYRSNDRVGNVEDAKTENFTIDKTAPTFVLKVNWATFEGASVFEDYQPLSFIVEAEDNLSGMATSSIVVDGEPYQPGTQMDYAGKLGQHSIVIVVEDKAGNKAEASYTFEITTSIDSMQELLNRYKASGEIKNPLFMQLSNDLKQAEFFMDKVEKQLGIDKQDKDKGLKIRHKINDLIEYIRDKVEQKLAEADLKMAVKHMEDFKKHLNNEAMSRFVSENAKAVLNTDADALIEAWTKE